MKKLLVTATALSCEHEARGEEGNKLPSKPSLVVQIGPESPEDTFFGEN